MEFAADPGFVASHQTLLVCQTVAGELRIPSVSEDAGATGAAGFHPQHMLVSTPY